MSTAAGPRDPLADPDSTAPTLNVANVLTVLRLLLVPVFALLLLARDGDDDVLRYAACGVFALASYTDRLDGQIARTRGLVTAFGKLADPIADKALTGAALVGLSLLGELPWLVTVVVLVREVGITVLRFVVIRHGVMPASRGGKLKTLLQGLALGLYVLPLSGPPASLRAVVMGVAVAVTVVTGADYVARAVHLRRTSPRADMKRARRAAAAPAVSGLRGAVVAVGDELLLGDVVNGNAAVLGEALAQVGVAVVHSSAVGDDTARIVTALRRALEDADVVVVTGGLGPTSDDRTRDALAALAGTALERSPALAAELVARYAAYGRPATPEVLRQADVPRGARPIDNPVGSAPGLALEVGDRLVVALPGPPHEMRAVAEVGLLPVLAARTGTRVTTRTLRCAGTGESDVAARVEAAVPALPPGVDLAYLAGSGLVRVRFTTSGDPAVLEPLVQACAAALGDDVFGRDDQSLPEVVGALLLARGQTAATAESLTGGLLGAALSERPGSSATYRGGLVAYATGAKATLAGVPEPVLAEHGAVSATTAAALAEGARDRLAADWGIATTGVAGPDEQEGHPVGTVHLAVAGPDGTTVRTTRFPGDRERVRVLTVASALDLLRRRLQRAAP